MFDSIVLDVVIGLVFIYLLHSLLASIVQEIIATNLGLRAKVLEKAILRMLQDEKPSTRFAARFLSWKRLLFPGDNLKNSPIACAFYNHGLIKYLAEDKWHRKPAYMTAKNFSKVMIDLLRGYDAKVGDDFRVRIDAMLAIGKIDQSTPSKPNQQYSLDEGTLVYLRSLWADSQGDVEKFKTSLENWFDDTMARASGWYKRYVQLLLFAIGFTMAVVFNIDTLQIVDKLSKDPELRAQLVQHADKYLKDNTYLKAEIDSMKKKDPKSLDSVTTIGQYDLLVERNDSLINAASTMVESDINKVDNLLGMGWEHKKSLKKCEFPYKLKGKVFSFSVLLGWIITGIAISMGAPFWFDLLSKLMKLKGNGDLPDNSSDKTNITIQPKG
jgi:hypothetical protein